MPPETAAQRPPKASPPRGHSNAAKRPSDGRLRANRPREEQALAAQLGYRYSRLPIVLKLLVDAAATTIRQLDRVKADQLAGRTVSNEEVTRLGRLLATFLGQLELDKDGIAARRKRERQAAIEVEHRRMGINTRRPGDR